jgi:2-methylcitrate dehydratase PrpD
VDLKYEDLPKEVVEQAKLLTLHTLGVSLGSYPIGQAKRAIALVKDQGGKKESTVIGDGTRVPCTNAAFVNGTMADILDWEDCSWTGHPSAGAIPAAFAVAEATNASGKEFIASVVAGYEVYQRIAMAVQPSTERRVKVRSWGLVSWQIYSAVIPAAKLLKLDRDRMAQALGVAYYLVNIPASKHAAASFGKSDVYHYAHGFNARNGVLSALVAKSGIDGMYDSLDGDNGYWALVSDQCDWSWYEKGLGRDYLIMETLFKHWPANMWIQGPLDALDALVKEHKIRSDDVSEITLSPVIDMIMTYRPEGYPALLDAEFSVPFCFASYLLEPDPGPNWYAEEKFRDSRILELASKVKGTGPTVTAYDNFGIFWKGSFPEVTVEITLKNGKKFSKSLRFPKGHPKNRLTYDEYKDRFRRAASFALKPEKIEKAIDRILKLEEVNDMSEIGELMHN